MASQSWKIVSQSWKILLAVCLALVLAIILYLVANSLLDNSKGADQVKLPILAVLGIVFLLGTLALVATVFQILELDDKTQALALPEGSIRAVIALSLIVLFAILSVYLYGGMSSTKVATAADLNRAQMEALRQSVGPALVSIVPDPIDTKAEKFTIIFKDRNASADDFAKQLLTLLGTLMTAVTSFYFASKAVTSAQAGSDSAPPKIIKVLPQELKAGSTDVQLTITGARLNLIKSASLHQDTNSISGANVLSNDSLVSATFSIPADVKVGKWDVVVEDGLGRSDRLSGGVSISTP